MKTVEISALVIGAGPAGYPAGIRLGQLGVKTVVVDKEYAGGVCLNVGCIPSKALITAAKNFEKMRSGEEMGLYADNPRIDMKRLQAWKGDIVKKLTGGVKSLLKANGSEFVLGEARIGKLEGQKREVFVKTAGEEVRYLCDHVVVATGSRPIEIPGFKFDQQRVLDSTGGLALDAAPPRLAVIGGGYIGLELGMCLAKLGSKVTVVEATPTLLPGTDPEMVKLVEKKLKKLGVEVLLETKAIAMTPKGCKVQPKDGPERELEADKVLVTVGRRPNLTGFGLEEAGVKIDKGRVVVDAQLRTNVPGIYAIGDIAPGPMLAHKGTHEGEVVAEVIAGKKAANDVRCIPAVIFTDPEIATVGLTEVEAKAAGKNIKVGKFPFVASGRALSTGDSEGFVKVICEAAEPHVVLGVHIVGAGASDLISEAALAIEMGAVADDLSLTVHPHPTLPESLMEAAKAALGEAVHIVNR